MYTEMERVLAQAVASSHLGFLLGILGSRQEGKEVSLTFTPPFSVLQATSRATWKQLKQNAF